RGRERTAQGDAKWRDAGRCDGDRGDASGHRVNAEPMRGAQARAVGAFAGGASGSMRATVVRMERPTGAGSPREVRNRPNSLLQSGARSAVLEQGHPAHLLASVTARQADREG